MFSKAGNTQYIAGLLKTDGIQSPMASVYTLNYNTGQFAAFVGIGSLAVATARIISPANEFLYSDAADNLTAPVTAFNVSAWVAQTAKPIATAQTAFDVTINRTLAAGTNALYLPADLEMDDGDGNTRLVSDMFAEQLGESQPVYPAVFLRNNT